MVAVSITETIFPFSEVRPVVTFDLLTLQHAFANICKIATNANGYWCVKTSGAITHKTRTS